MILLVGSCWFLYPLLGAIFEDNNFQIVFASHDISILQVSILLMMVKQLMVLVALCGIKQGKYHHHL